CGKRWSPARRRGAIWSAEFVHTGASLRQPLGHFRPGIVVKLPRILTVAPSTANPGTVRLISMRVLALRRNRHRGGRLRPLWVRFLIAALAFVLAAPVVQAAECGPDFNAGGPDAE